MGYSKRKTREGIQPSLRERSNGKVVLNSYEPLTTRRPALDRYLDSESKNACMSMRVSMHEHAREHVTVGDSFVVVVVIFVNLNR